MIRHKLLNKTKKCYSSRTQIFSPTKQAHSIKPLQVSNLHQQQPSTTTISVHNLQSSHQHFVQIHGFSTIVRHLSSIRISNGVFGSPPCFATPCMWRLLGSRVKVTVATDSSAHLCASFSPQVLRSFSPRSCSTSQLGMACVGEESNRPQIWC
jgi:hypothetical protein